MQKMNAQRRKKGFTLAEVLIVVAIIGVLSGVAFIAVANYLRSMTQLEYDGIAKEGFVAAQNHLTMAENLGYLGSADSASSGDYGTKEAGTGTGTDNQNAVYYFTVARGDLFGSNGNRVLKLMLPFGSVDETVRAGGSYIIRYQAQPALVLDVFYSNPSGRFGHTFTSDEYSAVMALANEGSRNGRRNYSGDVIGWYGGEAARTLVPGDPLEDPAIEVLNAARLQVKVKDPNKSGTLKLLLTGVTSESEQAIVLSGTAAEKASNPSNIRIEGPDANDEYTVTLDDVTASGQHFAELFPAFIPGEDLRIQAMAYDNSVLTNIAYSAEKTANSLFADLDTETAGEGSSAGSVSTAYIGNIRHLENLDKRVSSLNAESSKKQIAVDAAKQVNDLIWKDFTDEIGTANLSVYAGQEPTASGCFLPVIPPDGIDYQGDLQKIEGITVKVSGNAGIFASLKDGSVSSLLVTDTTVTGSGSGNAGLLAGSTDGTAVKGCAAFGTVSGAGDVGGLIGFASRGSVEGSYSAGHTNDGAYSDTSFDVTSSGGAAGGLIGNVAGATVSSCYSTCSVSGSGAAGGFAGSAGSGTTIGNSYTTGLVKGTSVVGAFVGSSSASLNGNHYYEIMNPISPAEGTESGTSGNAEETFLPPVGSGSAAGVSALDESADTFNAFCGPFTDWAAAEPADKTLESWYAGMYSLPGIAKLLGSPSADPGYEYFKTHYGDWPAPEGFIVNVG